MDLILLSINVILCSILMSNVESDIAWCNEMCFNKGLWLATAYFLSLFIFFVNSSTIGGYPVSCQVVVDCGSQTNKVDQRVAYGVKLTQIC